MLPGKTYTPDEIKSILWRGRWWILLPFAVGLALAPVIASYVPELYRSETVLMVIPQRIPDSYVRSTVTASVQDRLFSISDQILSRSRLERIITEFDLYPSERRASPMEDVVATMRDRDIELQPPGREQSFRVSFTSTDPATAQKVAARLASMFIDENTREREKLAESTSVFLGSQLKDAKARLLEHEQARGVPAAEFWRAALADDSEHSSDPKQPDADAEHQRSDEPGAREAAPGRAAARGAHAPSIGDRGSR
jgi:uncharacterized protein involved in exopolysaccharide biosynthesis